MGENDAEPDRQDKEALRKRRVLERVIGEGRDFRGSKGVPTSVLNNSKNY